MNQTRTKSHIYITAVIITYEPDLLALEKLIISLRKQVDKIVIVDNGSGTECLKFINNLITVDEILIELNINFGIAYAQNKGIKKSIEDPRCTHILFSDQDSIPATDMIDHLLTAFTCTEVNDSRPIAAVGPTRSDSRTERQSFFMLDQGGLPKRSNKLLQVEPEKKTFNVMSLIASGTLISVEAFNLIGYLRDDYFIDHVDTEWCFRARQKGYRLIGVTDAILNHRLGDRIDKVWFFGFRRVTLHSPLRNYYMLRNTVQMIRDVEMSFLWALYLISRIIKVCLYSLVYGPDRKRRLRLIVLGICHGVIGKQGKLNPVTGKVESVLDLAEDYQKLSLFS